MTSKYSWAGPVSGDYGDAADWSPQTVPGSADAVQIDAAGTYTVTASQNEAAYSLTLGSHATLDIAAGIFTVGSSGEELVVGSDAEITVQDGATLKLLGRKTTSEQSGSNNQIISGVVTVQSGGELLLATSNGYASTLVSGGGHIVLAGGDIQTNGAIVLSISTDVSGAGLIDVSGATGFDVAATLNADEAGETLTVKAVGIQESVTGTFEATSGGILDLTGDEVLGGNLVADGASSELLLTYGFRSQVTASSAGLVKLGSGTAGNLNAASDGLIQVSSSNLNGTLTTSGGGLIEFTSGANTINDGIQGDDMGYSPVSMSGAIQVDDGASLTVQTDALALAGALALGSTGSGASLTLESYHDFQPTDKSLPNREIVLSGGGTLALSDNADNLLAAGTASDIVMNEGEVISGAGRIGGGSALTLQNAGTIEASGTNALVIDLGAGKLSNQAAGVLEATGSGGLSFTAGAFSDSGLVQALDGSSVTVGSAVKLANDAAGVLTGGRWKAAGEGSTLSLAGGPAVTTDAAVVILSGVGTVFDTDGVALEQSLTNVAAKGKLELLAGRGWSSPNALSVDGQVLLAGSAFAPASLSVDAGGVVQGYGTISGPIADAGLVEASGGTLIVTGALSGAGVVEIASHDTLELAQAAPAGLDVKFGTGIDEVLKLDDPAGFAATLDRFAVDDTLDLAGETVASAAISGDTLAVTLSGGAVQDYALASPPSGLRIVLASDGAGGTDLSLHKATTASANAALLQAVAAWTPHSPATALHPSAPATDAAPLIAARHG